MIAALTLTLAIAAPAVTHRLECVAEGSGKMFDLAFTTDGATVGQVALGDPERALDPIGMSENKPKARLKFTGSAQGEGGFAFTGNGKAMKITLTLASNGGGFGFRFNGTRMDGTAQIDFDGEGSCAAKGTM